MRPAHRAPLVAALTAAAVLTVAGCGAAGAGVTPTTGAAAPSGSASSPPAAGTPGTSTSPGADPSSSAPATTKTFTFPDGRPSFEYPADWRVELFTGEQKPATSATATVFDATGTAQATIYAGKAADGVSFPVARTVFESAPVPGLGREPEPAAHYSFYVDRMDGRPTYRMHLTAGAAQPGDGSALDGIIRVGEGVLVAEVKFIDNPFEDDAAARKWLAGSEGQALKALLLSITY